MVRWPGHERRIENGLACVCVCVRGPRTSFHCNRKFIRNMLRVFSVMRTMITYNIARQIGVGPKNVKIVWGLGGGG